MRVQRFSKSVRPLTAALLLIAGLGLTGCTSGGITGLTIPANSPWDTITSVVHSPNNDVIVSGIGDGVTAQMAIQGQGSACTSDQGSFFVQCENPGCQPLGPAAECVNGAPAGTTNVTSLGTPEYVYGVLVTLDRSVFTSGTLLFASPSAGVLGATSLTLGQGSTLRMNTTFQEGVLPEPVAHRDSGDIREQAALLDDFSGVAFGPPWPDFSAAYSCVPGRSCDNGVSTDGVLAGCGTTLFGDTVLVRTNVPNLTDSTLQCGNVTFRFSIDPPFANQGDCVVQLFTQQCAGVPAGPSRATCYRNQVLTCQLLAVRSRRWQTFTVFDRLAVAIPGSAGILAGLLTPLFDSALLKSHG
jgi:hypothetical protein